MAKRKSKTSYQDDLLESLKNPAEAVEYLRAATEESDMPEVLLLAIRNVAEARGIAKVAKETKLNRENIYRMLSKKGNPVIRSLSAILNSLGLRLTVEMK